MKIIKILLLIFIVLPKVITAQKGSIMVTYSESKFLYAPGLEVNYFFYKNFGLQIGLSSYFLDYRPEQIANQYIKNNYYQYLYNVNAGVCNLIVDYKKIKLGWTAGWKMYYGPEFKPLYFYESGGYYIYSDVAGRKFIHGIDLGVMVYTKKHVLGIKYDTARGQIRWLAGWSF